MRASVINLRSGPEIKANLEQAEHWIRAAAKDGAAFVLTPENTLIMQTNTQKLFAAIRPEAETVAIGFFSELARELGIFLLIGSMAIRLSETKAANRSFLYGPDGQIVARYDKMHMFDVRINETETWCESANYQAGKAPVMADIGDFRLGLSICYDLRFAALYKYYARHGADIMSVPAAFTHITGQAHWQTLLKARAIETSSYVLAAAQGGVHAGGRRTWGHSMIVDPWGDILACLDHEEPGFVSADLSRARVEDIRARIPAWHQETQRP